METAAASATETKSTGGQNEALWKTIQPVLEQISNPRLIWSPAVSSPDLAPITPFMLLLHILKPISGTTKLPVDIDEKYPYDPMVYEIVEKTGMNGLDVSLTAAQQAYVIQVVNATLAAQKRRETEYAAACQRQQDEYKRTHPPCEYVMRGGARAGQVCGKIVVISVPAWLPAVLHGPVRCSSHKGK